MCSMQNAFIDIAHIKVEVVTQQAAFTMTVRLKKERNERKWKNDHAFDMLQ